MGSKLTGEYHADINELLLQIQELEAQLRTANKRLDFILNRAFIRDGGSIAIPCGPSGRMTKDEKRESIAQLDKAIGE